MGQYSPQGDSSYGCMDMSGNVWEWCLNKWDNPSDTTIDNSDDERVRRGGSWLYFHHLARAASRNYSRPVSRDNLVGFRVVAARRSPSHPDR